MVDKKAESKKEAAVPTKKTIKASTGAWWKTSSKEEKKETSQKASKAIAKTASKRAAVKKATPTAPKKNKPKKTVAPAKKEDSPEKLEEKKESQVQEKPAAKGKKPQKKRASSGNKGKQAKDEKPPLLKLLINAEEPEECRLALLADGHLDSIHVSTASSKQTKNNIYKARIVAVESSLQAAFVDYGTDKNGFLPFNEIHPEYYKQEISQQNKKLIEQRQWKKLRIHDVLERGTEVLVQVVKEEVGNKGANMTSYLSIPGRCVVHDARF